MPVILLLIVLGLAGAAYLYIRAADDEPAAATKSLAKSSGPTAAKASATTSEVGADPGARPAGAAGAKAHLAAETTTEALPPSPTTEALPPSPPTPLVTSTRSVSGATPPPPAVGEPLVRARISAPVEDWTPPPPRIGAVVVDQNVVEGDEEGFDDSRLERFTARSAPAYVPPVSVLITGEVPAIATGAAEGAETDDDPTVIDLRDEPASRLDDDIVLDPGAVEFFDEVADDDVIELRDGMIAEPEDAVPATSFAPEGDPIDQIISALVDRARERRIAVADVAAELIEQAELEDRAIDDVLADLVDRVDGAGRRSGEELILYNDAVPRRPGRLSQFEDMDSNEKKRVIVRVLCLLVASREDDPVLPPADAAVPAERAGFRVWSGPRPGGAGRRVLPERRLLRGRR